MRVWLGLEVAGLRLKRLGVDDLQRQLQLLNVQGVGSAGVDITTGST